MKTVRTIKIAIDSSPPILVNPEFQVLSVDHNQGIYGIELKLRVSEATNGRAGVAKRLAVTTTNQSIPDDAVYLTTIKGSKPVASYFYDKEPTLDYWLID